MSDPYSAHDELAVALETLRAIPTPFSQRRFTTMPSCCVVLGDDCPCGGATVTITPEETVRRAEAEWARDKAEKKGVSSCCAT